MRRFEIVPTLKSFSAAAAKAALLAAAFMFAGGIFSCSNMGGDVGGFSSAIVAQAALRNSSSAKKIVRVTGTIVETAMSRSVVPDISEVQTSVASYTVKAWGRKADGTLVPETSAIEGTVDFSAKTFSIGLEYGSWTLRADGWDGAGGTGNIVLTQTTAEPLVLDDDTPVASLNFALDYPKIAGKKGALDLTITFDTTLNIAQVSYSLNDGETQIAAGSVFASTLAGTLRVNSGLNSTFGELEPGDYQLEVDFRTSGGSIVVRLDQTVQIYSNITTKKIDGVAPYISGGAISINSDVVKKYQQSVVYVGGTGFNTGTDASDSNNGTQFDPVATVKRALAIVNASPLTASDIPDGFKIYIQANTTLDQDASIADGKKISFIGTNKSALYKIDGAATYGISTNASDLNFSYINFDRLNSFDVTGGQIKLNNCKITNGLRPASASTGGGICIKGTGAKAVLTSCSIGKCQANYGGAIYVNDDDAVGTAEVELNNCLIGAASDSPAQSGDTKHSNSAQSGGGIYVGSSGKLTLKGSNTISYNYASINGGGINSNSNIALEGCDILANCAHSRGGGVYNDGTLTLESGTISGNTSDDHGGGVYNNGTFTMNGGEISGNEVTQAIDTYKYGGGIYNAASKSCSITDGTISQNSCSRYGGGIYNAGILDFSGGTISANKLPGAANATLGGAGVLSEGAFTMSEGEICGHEAEGTYSGAVMLNGSGSFTMTGGKICGNKTKGYTAGVYLYSTSAKFTMTGGTIEDNESSRSSSEKGGAVCLHYGTFEMGGSAYIPAGTEGKNVVYLFETTSGVTTHLSLASSLTETRLPVATIKPGIYGSGKTVIVLASPTTVTSLPDELAKFAVADDSAGDSWTIGYNAAADEGVLASANIYVNGSATGSGTGTKTDPCKTVAAALALVTAPNTNIIVQEKTTETESIVIPASAQGLTIKATGGTLHNWVMGSTSLTIKVNAAATFDGVLFGTWGGIDISSGVKGVKFKDASINMCSNDIAGGALYLGSGAEVEAKNLTVETCFVSAVGNGGGIYISDGATLSLDGLVMKNCMVRGANSDGGGIYNGGTLIAKDAKITNCSTTGCGNGIYSALGALTVLDGDCNIDSDIYLYDATHPLNVKEDFALASGAAKIPLCCADASSAASHPYAENDAAIIGYDDGTSAHEVTEAQVNCFATSGMALSLQYDGTVTPPCGKLIDKSIHGGITVSLAGNISFTIAVPSLTSARAAFEVKDNSSSPATSVTPDSARVEIRQYGSAIYAAADQEVAAPYLAAGSYELYCKAVIGGVVYDTTVPFGYGALYTPLTLEAEGASTTVTFDNKATGDVTYRVNGGTAQTIAAGTAETITLNNAGDYVQFYGTNAAYATDTTDGNYSNIACNKNCYVYGNIMSLVKSDGFESQKTLTSNYTFCGLFKGNAYIKNKTGADLLLPATTLADYCYRSMFSGCTSLTSSPALPAIEVKKECYNYMFSGCTNLLYAPNLNATTLSNYCYAYMFSECESLTSAPALPATTLATSCYFGMFSYCTSLTSAPALPATEMKMLCYCNMFSGCTSLASAPTLPATTVDQACYQGMFSGCSSLTSAPELPVATLWSYCYQYMFKGCTSLTTAPDLPATKLVDGCYKEMFNGCTNLNKVTCLATDISASDCTTDWLDGVATSGTFTKAAAMTGWTVDSASGIPTGWTVESSGSAGTEGMVLIHAGTFTRAENSAAATSGQRYTITLTKDFYICDHEVTQKEWAAVMGNTQADLITAASGSDKGSGDNYPVYYVNWYHAIAYCNKLSLAEGKTPCYEVTGVDFAALTFDQIPTTSGTAWESATCNFAKNGYRLPTEAEWEYAALGDYKDNSNWNGYGDSSNSSAVVFAGYNGSNSMDDYAWYVGNSTSKTHEVKTTTGANSHGLCDMSGNVCEWCWDWYKSGQYATDGNASDPRGAPSGSSRVYRGGGWSNGADYCSVASRGGSDPNYRRNFIGFRVVRNAP